MNPNDPHLTSFVDVPPGSHFPIQNLPFGIFSTARAPRARAGVAIGASILDLSVLEREGLLRVRDDGRALFDGAQLTPFIGEGAAAWRAVRARVSVLLRADNPLLRDDRALRERALVPMAEASLHLPLEPPGYTDFYSSKEHATNVGRLYRDPARALLPNWLEMPVAYNGRASAIVASGTPVRRPCGLRPAGDGGRPVFGPSRKLDFELETAFIVGTGNALGEPLGVAEAEQHIFGMVLMNDWSARDIQQFEYVPLGPFNGKNFATSISPWVVTLAALEPFRTRGPIQDPEPAPYLRQAGPHAFDIALCAQLRPNGEKLQTTLCRTNFKTLYWSMAQQLAHHTIGGCPLRPGDLMGSGTISGPGPDALGSLLEITRDGTAPLLCAGGATRAFLEDGDVVSIAGACRAGEYLVGFGEVRGQVIPGP